MPYMPPSEASFSLPCLLFAAITQGGVDEVGGLDIDVGDQGGSDSNLVKKCWGPGTPAPQWLADDHCTPHTHALIPTSRTPSPLRWQWMKQCLLLDDSCCCCCGSILWSHVLCNHLRRTYRRLFPTNISGVTAARDDPAQIDPQQLLDPPTLYWLQLVLWDLTLLTPDIVFPPKIKPQLFTVNQSPEHLPTINFIGSE